MCVYPKSPDGEWPISFSTNQAFGFELSHSDHRFSWHGSQFPHAMVNGTTTRSPTFNFAESTPGPVCMTSPMNSWPRMSPCARVGTIPSYRYRSDPQMHVVVTRIMA